MSKKNKANASLNDLMGEWEEVEKPVSIGSRLTAFLALIAVAAVCVSALVAPIGFASAAGVNATVGYWDSLEDELLKDEIRLPQKTVLLDREGNEFAQFYSENRESIGIDEMNEDFINGLVATEDSRFYETNGVDFIGLARSFASTVTGDEKQGASGITQQLVKNILILNAETPEDLDEVQNRVLSTKAQEIRYAVHMEEKYTKEELLEMYSNTVYFGNRAYGLQAAAKTYFDTTPDKLTLEESAMLVGVINNPTVFDPFTNPENADRRKNTVLWRMLQENNITQEQYDESVEVKVEPRRGVSENGCGQSEYPYYCQLVRQEILNNDAFGDTAQARETFLYQGGLTITTAMDREAMDNVDRQVRSAWGTDNRVASGVAVIKPGTGQIVAIGQNREWEDTQVIYAKSERQTGSAFKPFTLATAYEQGIDAGNKVYNSDSNYRPQGYDYPKPRGFINFGGYDYGAVDGSTATRLSLNTWYVRMMQATGVVPVAEMANRIGLSVPTDPNNVRHESAVNPRSLSLTLGAWNASPVEMATAFSVFAGGGVKCDPVSILSAKRSDTGADVKVSDPKCHQAIMPNIANQMNKIMQEPFNDGGTAADYRLGDGRQIAGKTGTSNNKGDAWMVGYTPQYSTAVWSGDPRGSSHGLHQYTQYGRYTAGMQAGTGGPVSGPIFEDVMENLHAGEPKKNFPAPSNDVASAIKATAIPDVTGLKVDNAVTTLQQYGYEVAISENTSGDAKLVEKDTVVAQNPSGGNNGTFGQTVTLTLSPGSTVDIVINEPKIEKEEK